MPKTTTITCDQCGESLCKESMYPAHYGYRLTCENFRINTSGITYAICMQPAPFKELYFCSMACLKKKIETFDAEGV